MGRRKSLEHSHQKPGSLASETTEDNITNIAASEASFGEPHNSLRTAVPLRKPWSSSAAAEHGHNSGAMRSPSVYSASASNSSSDVVSQLSTRDTRTSPLPSQIDRWDSTAKSLFSSTGRALRKHASKLSLASSISYDKDEEGKVVWKLSGLGADDRDSIPSLSSARSKSWSQHCRYPSPNTWQGISSRERYQRPSTSSMSRTPIRSKFAAWKEPAEMSSSPSSAPFEPVNAPIHSSEASKPRVC